MASPENFPPPPCTKSNYLHSQLSPFVPSSTEIKSPRSESQSSQASLESNKIPVILSYSVSHKQVSHGDTSSQPPSFQSLSPENGLQRRRYRKNLKTVRRIPKQVKPTSLLTIISLNPRSIYGRTQELSTLVQEYKGSIICLSESWRQFAFDRDN